MSTFPSEQSHKNRNGSRIAMPWLLSWKRIWRHKSVADGPLSTIFGRQMQSDMFAEAVWGALWRCLNWPCTCPQNSKYLWKTWQFTTSYKDAGSKIAELKQQISQKMILGYFEAQWHFGNVLQNSIIFCDICCFSSAILLPSSLQDVANCQVFH